MSQIYIEIKNIMDISKHILKNTKVDFRTPKKKSSGMLTTATVHFSTQNFGVITLKGFVVWKSSYVHPLLKAKINITPYRRSIFGNYIDMYWFENEAIWSQIQLFIYKEFLIQFRGTSKKENENEIDIDQIIKELEES